MTANLTAPEPTALPEPSAAEPDDVPSEAELEQLRQRINHIDDEIIRLWRERSQVSKEVGRIRMASGGTRLVLARERQICERFREALGTDGTQLALLLLRAGRGPL